MSEKILRFYHPGLRGSPTQLAWLKSSTECGFGRYYGYEEISEMIDWGPPCGASPDVYPTYSDLVRALKAGHSIAYRDQAYEGEATVAELQLWINETVSRLIAEQKVAKAAEKEAKRLEMEEWRRAREEKIAEYDAKVAQLCAERGLVVLLDDGRAGHFNFLPKEEMIKEAVHLDYDTPGWSPVIYTSLGGRALVDERTGRVYAEPGSKEEIFAMQKAYQEVQEAKRSAQQDQINAINERITASAEKKKAEGKVKRLEQFSSAALGKLAQMIKKKVTSRNVDTIEAKLEAVWRSYEHYTSELNATYEILGRPRLDEAIQRDEVEVKIETITTYAASLVACSVCGTKLRKNSLRSHEKKCLAKRIEEEQAEKEQMEREAEYQAKRVARNARFREEQERKKAEREAREAEEKLQKEEILEVAVSDASPPIAAAINKLRRAPKNSASERQVAFTCSRFEQVFGRQLSDELVAKLEVGSKKSVGGIIDKINAASITMTLQHGRRNGAPSEKQVSYAKRLLNQVYATDWESSRLGKAGVPFPEPGILGKLGRVEVSSVIDQLKYLASRNAY